MYETTYNFTGSPFQLTPDTRFFYGSRGHSRAIAHLTFGLAQGEGFIIVTGEVGTGKTMLIERLRSQFDRDTYAAARIDTPRFPARICSAWCWQASAWRNWRRARRRCCSTSRRRCAATGWPGGAAC